MLTRILTAAAFSALLVGAANAQDTTYPADPAADAMAQGMAEPAPMTHSTTTAAVVVAGPPPAGATNVTVRTVTNGPVPDTAENRARFGQPMSNAGKRTTPAGN